MFCWHLIPPLILFLLFMCLVCQSRRQPFESWNKMFKLSHIPESMPLCRENRFRLLSDSQRTCDGLQPLIKHLPIGLWHCCVQLRQDMVTRLICRPSTLWQHIWGVYHAGMVVAELLSKQMKISFQPVCYCVAITGQCCIVPLHDPMTPLGDSVEEDGWISVWWVFMFGKTSDVITAEPSLHFWDTQKNSYLDVVWEGKSHWSAPSPAAAFRSQQQQPALI